MKRALSLGAGLLLLLAAAAPASGQEAGPCPATRPEGADTTRRPPDVVLSATVHIRELRFETSPRAEIELTGCPSLDTVRVERVNLPSPVQPGVTYRDVTVRIEASGYLRIQCLLPALASDTTAAARALAGLCEPPDTLRRPVR